jgi:hypothetical protein
VARAGCCKSFFHAGLPAGEPREELLCLDYDDECAACGRSRAGLGWTPEAELDE